MNEIIETTKPKKKSKAWMCVRRVLLCLGTFILLAALALVMVCNAVFNGPSETARDMAVVSSNEASFTRGWLAPLILGEELAGEILAKSEQVTVDVMSAEEFAKLHATNTDENTDAPVDEWADAKDGVKLIVESGSTFKAYILLVKDPSRVFVGVSSENFSTATAGKDIFNVTSKYDALAGINGGEFLDAGGMGTGAKPMGMTYSLGKCVWSENSKRTFIGFDKDNNLFVSEGITKGEAEAAGIRDAVSFQTGNVLIKTTDDNINVYYQQSNTGVAQRTAIGQRADGTVIMIVTDGRTASSLGATHNDMIDMMVSYGAVNAAMLDGGSSAMLYYENYFDKYDFNKDELDEYQLQGMVNKYKAFTRPRSIPTYFLVSKEG